MFALSASNKLNSWSSSLSRLCLTLLEATFIFVMVSVTHNVLGRAPALQRSDLCGNRHLVISENGVRSSKFKFEYRIYILPTCVNCLVGISKVIYHYDMFISGYIKLTAHARRRTVDVILRSNFELRTPFSEITRCLITLGTGTQCLLW